MDRSDTALPDWTPRHAWAWAVLTCVVCTMLLAWPALSGGFLVNPHSDQYIAGYPYRHFAAEMLRAGQGFPQWNPYLQGGLPYVAAMHGDIFYPTFLLRLLLPTDIAMTWGFVLHTMLAGIFTIGFLRSVGMGLLPASVGGVAYMLSGQLASFPSPGHDGKLFVSTLLPLTLWLLVLGVRDGRRWAWGALAFVVGLGVLSPHPQLLQYMLLTSGAFALFAAFKPGALARPSMVEAVRHPAARASSKASDDDAGVEQKRGLPRLGLALGAVLIGFAIGAVQFLPVSEYVEWSPRAGGKGYEYASSYSMPLEETINMWIPQFSGILDNYWGANGIHFHSEYLGVAVLLLAAAGLAGGVHRHARAHAWFWLGAFIVTLFWAWGGNTPFYKLVYAIVPGSKFFRAPSTILYVVSFSAAMLAAFGAERLLAGRLSTKFAIGAGVAGVLTALLGLTGGFTRIAESVMWNSGVIPAIDANAAAVTSGSLRVAAIALVVAALAWLRSQQRISTRAVGIALVAVTALDLWSVGRHYWLFSEGAEQLYASDAAIDYVNSAEQPGRVLALALQGGEPPARRDPFLGGSALMAHQVRDVLGYQGNELGRYRRLIETAGNDILGNPNFWALTNSQYLYTNLPDLPLPGAERLAGPTTNAAGSTVYLHRLPGENPYAWVVPLRVTADDEATLATVLDPRFDLARAALFAPDANVDAKPASEISALPDTLAVRARVTSYAPGAVDISLEGDVPAGAALVVSENYYPGWSATVDGQSAIVARTDYVLSGVALPDGAKTVQLRFENPNNATGMYITLFALLLAAGWAVYGVLQERRSVHA